MRTTRFSFGRRAALTATLAAVLVPSAHAQGTPPGLRVTFAARVCDDYADVRANRARNNIQESLKDLGANTPYKDGELVDAVVEDTVQPPPTCRPLPGWKFTLGTKYKAAGSVGAWGSLTTITDPLADAIVTQDSVPLLTNKGAPSGAAIAGATTIALSPPQADLASRANLWVQGGIPSNPVGANLATGEVPYGFAALRCATDNVNGDNVEYIRIPTGVYHVVCFAYYIQPPPAAGTIKIVKQTVGGPTTSSFGFGGNTSYEPGGGFTISVAGSTGSQQFTRGATPAGGQPWVVSENGQASWNLTGVSCVSKLGTSTADATTSSRAASIRLGAGDTMTCTFQNTWIPPAGGLVLEKITRGGVGTFPFAVTPVNGGKPVLATARTTLPDTPTIADPAHLALAPGDYFIDEDAPASKSGGRWALTGVVCNGKTLSTSGRQRVTIASGQDTVCTYRNTFTPLGSLKIRLVTIGALTTGSYVIKLADDTTESSDETGLVQRATTAAQSQPVLATGDSTASLQLGSYGVVQSLVPVSAARKWTLIAVICDGLPISFEQGRAVVPLTPGHPDRDCTFINQSLPLEPVPEPPIPAPVPSVPDDGGVLDDIVSPEATLRIKKTVDHRVVRVGQVARYRIEVKNEGVFPATEVYVAEQRRSTASWGQIVSAGSSRGRCERAQVPNGLARTCVIGTLAPGESVTVDATVRILKTGTHRNTVAVGSATDLSPASVLSSSVRIDAIARIRPITGLG